MYMLITMPNRTVYIRKLDLEKWDGVANKSEFIHNALNNVGDFEKYVLDAVEKNLGGDLKGLAPIVKPLKTPLADALQVIKSCPHGADPKFCKHAKWDKTRKQKWCK